MYYYPSYILTACVIFISTIAIGQSYLDILDNNSIDKYQLINEQVDSAIQSQSEFELSKNYKHFRRWKLATEAHLGPDGALTNYVAKNLKA